MPPGVPVLFVVVGHGSDGCFTLSSSCWKQKGFGKKLLKILKIKEVGIWQTSVKMKLYVLRLSKQKLIDVNWSENFLIRNSLLIKGYIMMS